MFPSRGPAAGAGSRRSGYGAVMGSPFASHE